jgi:hypothetical protein
MTETVELAVAPPLSVTVRIALNTPPVVYVWFGFDAVLGVLPSPKVQLNPSMNPSESLDPLEENCTNNGA